MKMSKRFPFFLTVKRRQRAVKRRWAVPAKIINEPATVVSNWQMQMDLKMGGLHQLFSQLLIGSKGKTPENVFIK